MNAPVPQMHIRKVGNGYIATVTLGVNNRRVTFEDPPFITEEVVFENLDALCVFMFHHFERDFITEVVEKSKRRKKELAISDAYDELTELQRDGKNYLYKANYEKVFPDFNKKKF